ncbi:MAG: threonine ammonia-lyase [Solirubrobacterales bacterium]
MTQRPTLDDVQRARDLVADVVRHTPMIKSRFLSRTAHGTISLKAENLQRTGSFKLRGALNKIASLGPEIRGVVTGSAGNHGLALAYAARERGLSATIFMPERASLAKVAAAREFGADVVLGGRSIDECVVTAKQRADEQNLAFVHPFDDPAVIAGQGTIGLELLEDVPDLARVVVPIGGGGLASGIATAVKAGREGVDVIGVQAQACAPVPGSLRQGKPVEVAGGSTLADGIAVKRPGEITLPLLESLVDEVVEVGEEPIAEAIVLLLERTKLVVEGAGAVGVAAVVEGAVSPAPSGTTAVILSGGNIDIGVLGDIARHHETVTGRRLRVFTTIPDEPGSLAALLTRLGEGGANLIDVDHVREGVGLSVGETGVELVMETRGPDHAKRLLELISESGYAARVLD